MGQDAKLQRNYIQDWINQDDTFHPERYMHALFLQKQKEDLSALRQKLKESDAAIRKDVEGKLSKLKQGKTMGYNKDGESIKVTAYKHPYHHNEALFVQEVDYQDQPIYRILDCYGDSHHFSTLEDALAEFLGLEGQLMWMDALAAGHHNSSDIWIQDTKRSVPMGFA